MHKRIKVSVCVPVYNGEQFISECLDSLINQTLRELEIVCVDDGSTDNSPAILDNYAKKHSNVIVVHQENTGLGGARNAGIKNAHGEYIGFVDADDYVDYNMFESLYELAIENHCEIAMCGMVFTPNFSTKKHLWYKPFTGEITGEFLDRNIQPCNKIVSRKLIDRINFEFFPKNGDDMFIILMLHSKGIISTDDKMYHYRVGNETMSTSLKIDNFLNFIDCTKKQIEEYEKTQYKDSLHEYFEYRMIYVLIQTMAVAALRRKKSTYEMCRKELKRLNFKKNCYMKKLLKNEFSAIEYTSMVHILPTNYYISSMLTKIKLGNWR